MRDEAALLPGRHNSVMADNGPVASKIDDIPTWRKAGLRYHTYRHFLSRKFGSRRVQKVSLDAGFTCPNVDGTVAIGGCTFCDNRSFSPSRRNRLITGPHRDLNQKIIHQLDDGIRRLKHR